MIALTQMRSLNSQVCDRWMWSLIPWFSNTWPKNKKSNDWRSRMPKCKAAAPTAAATHRLEKICGNGATVEWPISSKMATTPVVSSSRTLVGRGVFDSADDLILFERGEEFWFLNTHDNISSFYLFVAWTQDIIMIWIHADTFTFIFVWYKQTFDQINLLVLWLLFIDFHLMHVFIRFDTFYYWIETNKQMGTSDKTIVNYILWNMTIEI